MTDENLADDKVKFHKKYLSNGITEVTAWSLIPVKECVAHDLHKKWGIESLPHNFKIDQKKDGAYVSTWTYCDQERVDNDG
ncbi:hypothetical protein CCP1ISM_1170004 [Azospirillaceae bacterium]